MTINDKISVDSDRLFYFTKIDTPYIFTFYLSGEKTWILSR